jgi:uncharacterized repeat protein (TIGR02543 family)
MEFRKLGIIALVAVLIVSGIGAYILLSDHEAVSQDGGAGHTGYVYSEDTALSWSYWLGNVESPGVTDAKTPITEGSMTEIWKISDVIDGSSTNWKVPGSAICVGNYTYFFRGSDSTLNCVVTSTGVTVAKVSCPSDSVYNMAIAYGDGKIFVPTLSGSYTTVYVFDSETLEQLFVSEPIQGGEVQGAIVYYEGKVYFGTYCGEFACISSEDMDASTGNEISDVLWAVEGSGWYNATPAFFGDYCVIVEKGYDIGGAVAYCVNIDTGAIEDTMLFDMEYCVSGVVAYEGRVYIALNSVTDKEDATSETNLGKTLVIRSFMVTSDGDIDNSSEKVWMSDVENGGTQSIPVIWNDRLYIGGGGSTMGTDEPFTVIDIADDGTMSTAYTVDDLKTKGTATITTAYSTEENGYAVYIYVIEYGNVKTGESSDSTIGSADIYVLKDTVGQTTADIVFTLTPSVEQFAYQSFSISPDGYLLIRNDSTLFCYGFDTVQEYTAEDVENNIDRTLSMSEDGNINVADIERIEERYSSLSDSEKASVTNYEELQALYCDVTFVIGTESVTERVLSGCYVSVPQMAVPSGKTLVGWESSSGTWDICGSVVSSDVVLTAELEDACQVSFDTLGGSSQSAIYVSEGSELGYVPDPVKTGYTFGGWYLDGTRCYPQYSVISSDITLIVSWLKDSTVYFNSDGGSSASSISVVYSKDIGTLPIVKRTGYSFLGWYYGDVLFTEDTKYPYDNDITLVAKWVENDESTITNGNGISVSGAFPDDVTLTVVKPFSGSSSLTAIKSAASGASLDYLLLTISGDGIDGSVLFDLLLPVGSSYDGQQMDVYYYVSNVGVTKVTGTVTNGILAVTVQGSTGGGGVQIVIGLASGTDLLNHM